MKKRVLSLVLAVVMCIALMPTAFATDAESVLVGDTALQLDQYLASGSTAATTEQPAEGGYAHFYLDGGLPILELNNFTYEGPGHAYTAADGARTAAILIGSEISVVQIETTGKNVIKNTDTGRGDGIVSLAEGSIINLTGDGVLDVTASESGFVAPLVLFSYGEVHVQAAYGAESPNVWVMATVLEVNAAKEAFLTTRENMEISGGVTMEGGADAASSRVITEYAGEKYICVSPYNILIAGEQISSKNLSGEGWSFDPATTTLTLTDADIDVAGNAIHASFGDSGTLTIHGVGRSTIRAKGSISTYVDEEGYEYTDIEGGHAILIEGEGDLVLTGTFGAIAGDTFAIYADEAVKIEGKIDEIVSGFTGIVSYFRSVEIPGEIGKIVIRNDNGQGHHGIQAESVVISGKLGGISAEAAAINSAEITLSGEIGTIAGKYAAIEAYTYNDDSCGTVTISAPVVIHTIEEGGLPICAQGAIEIDPALEILSPAGGKIKENDVGHFVVVDGSGETAGTVVIGTPAEEAPAEGLPFTDVTEGDAIYESVKFMYDNGLMVGVGDGTTFAPETGLSRAMLARILHVYEQTPVALTSTFTDVARSFWYTDAVDWATQFGVISGYGDGRFGPNDTLTREQMAVMLYQYARGCFYDVSAGLDTNILSYTDADKISSWAIEAVQWACAEGILTETDGALRPTEAATRADVAASVMALVQRYA